ncbi:MAG: CRISPR-associated endonuclease Cas1 [Candidatus Cybelea sp.]
MKNQKFTLPYPSLQVRAGVLVSDGYGISLRVLYGKLHIEDGIGPHRRSIVLDRAGSGLERLVLLGKSGTLTLEALAWLRAIGATLVQLSPSGDVLAHSVPFGYDGQPIRRAQALAVATGLDVEVARNLIARKLTGQRANLSRLRVNLQGFDALCETLKHADSIERVRVCEAQAAAIYWNAWSSVPIRLRSRDLTRVPTRWARYDSRASILTGAPRAATNPVNSLLNYTYALLESEARLALLAAGLDPTLGVLHADQRNRDSFALDVMEPVRPNVDAFLLDLLEDRVFTSRDFVELSNGVCRVAAPLSHELALTLPHWRECLRPIVADLAQTFREALTARTIEARIRPVNVALRRTKPGPQPSPLSQTLRRTSQPRPYASKLWGALNAEGLAASAIPCALCGEQVLKRRRRHCDKCMPKARREHGLRAIETARKALAAQTAAGNDPGRCAPVNRARGEAIEEGHRRNREWTQEHGEKPRHEAWFKREIVPKLDAFSLNEIGEATGLSLAACSRIRAGARVPHPRHWAVLLTLIRQDRNSRCLPGRLGSDCPTWVGWPGMRRFVNRFDHALGGFLACNRKHSAAAASSL